MADPQERDVPSLEDEIFAVAQSVQEDPGADAARPRLRLRSERALDIAERTRSLSGREVGAIAAGFGLFVFIDFVMMYAPLMMSRRPSLLPQFVTLLVLAFGLGGLLVWKVGGRWRPFGAGMMLAWVFLTLVSVGFLTGVTVTL
ncbi:hypothetical protein [Actinomadura verrucosospora]|uniref:Uncharacterized protein n=1 Tax=Actinomadura verrucosospora TaxID=46165 RepID=A0A7D3VUD2_ACTVE|nr:hypothetical protein [Actinomadura verrucosospora]QKG23555.1 hypothetical protein ACTIVE_5198 [Actinomadura verrucosospora]